MKFLIRIAALAAVVALLGACCKCRSYQRKYSKPLVGTEWQLVQLNGQDLQPEADRYTVLFGADGRLSGVGACNRLTGTYQLGENRAVAISQLASTRMACPGMDREQTFMDMLTATTHYEMDGPMLMLLTDGELRAVFQAKP